MRRSSSMRSGNIKLKLTRAALSLSVSLLSGSVASGQEGESAVYAEQQPDSITGSWDVQRDGLHKAAIVLEVGLVGGEGSRVARSSSVTALDKG